MESVLEKYRKKRPGNKTKGTLIGNAMDAAAKTKKRSKQRGIAPSVEDAPTGAYTPRRGGNQ